jgi:hypothetical protein
MRAAARVRVRVRPASFVTPRLVCSTVVQRRNADALTVITQAALRVGARRTAAHPRRPAQSR